MFKTPFNNVEAPDVPVVVKLLNGFSSIAMSTIL